MHAWSHSAYVALEYDGSASSEEEDHCSSSSSMSEEEEAEEILILLLAYKKEPKGSEEKCGFDLFLREEENKESTT